MDPMQADFLKGFLGQASGELWDFLVNAMGGLLILIVGIFAGGRLARIVGRGASRTNCDQVLSSFLESIVRYTLLAVVVIMALSQFGIPTTSLVAILGTAGLALALALKDYLSNFAAGVMLLMFRHFRHGDLVELSGVLGKVKSLNISDTVLDTVDNRRVTIPNSKVLGNVIINLSTNPTRRLDVLVGISYEDDIGKALKISLEICQKNQSVLSDPAPQVFVSDLGDSSVDLTLRVWVNRADIITAKAELLQSCKDVFDERGISIPFPQTDIHIKQST